MYEADQDLHSIIYTGSSPPAPQEQIARIPKEGRRPSGEVGVFDESGMTKDPIRMTVDHVSYALNPASRLHFGRVYSVKHDTRVKSLGVIHVDSITKVIEYYNSAQEEIPVRHHVWKTVQRIKQRFTNTYPKLEYPTKALDEDYHVQNQQVKSMARLKALCESDQAELFVIATYDSDVHYHDQLSQQLHRHPNRLRFRKGDRIRVLDEASTTTFDNDDDDKQTVSTLPGKTEGKAPDDLTEVNITWWTGELNGLQGDFPWWYGEID